jgi:hypothetical protein
MIYNLIAYKPFSEDIRRNCVVDSFYGDFDYSTHSNLQSLVNHWAEFLFKNLSLYGAEAKYGFLVYRNGKLCYDSVQYDGLTWECIYSWDDYENAEKDEQEAKEAELDIICLLKIARELAEKKQEKFKAVELEKKRLANEKKLLAQEEKEKIELERLKQKYASQ